MWLCCCSFLMCAELKTLHLEQQQQQEEEEEEEDHSSFRMDMELLIDQYSSSRDRQRRHTHIVCFRNEYSEEMNSRGLLDVVPVCQISRSPSVKASVLDKQVECVLDPACESWSSDMTRTTHWIEAAEFRQQASGGGSESGSDWNPHVKGSRKLSAPALLSRQRSRHYPFPQRKSLRKSETARRLGLYASL